MARKQHEDQLAAQAAAQEAALAPARKLAAALVLKGYRLTVPEVHVGAKRPYVDSQGAMHWPVLLMYPETGQQDVIEDWHEEDLVADHLDVVSLYAEVLGSGFGTTGLDALGVAEDWCASSLCSWPPGCGEPVHRG